MTAPLAGPLRVNRVSAARRVRCARGWLTPFALIAALAAPTSVRAAPYIWDQDGDHIDDRVETVHVSGFAYSFEGLNPLGRQRIQVTQGISELAFGVYVVFDHPPTSADLATLATNGLVSLFRYEAIPAVRTVATFAQLQAAAALPGVVRVEAVPILYPMLHENVASAGVRDPSEHAFPTWAGTGGGDGGGVVVAILDTGVNDAVEGPFPGHESLRGRCVGGAEFTHGDSTLDTPRAGSVNPVDHGAALTSNHGTHVAGIAVGTGGASGYARGVAPGARFADVKVLNDAGVGTGVAEALDWCIHNRARDWGVPGYAGIQVINLSLSGPDVSDGNDVASALARRAVELGIVVVASMGNDGTAGHVPSPAAGDGVLAVGALDSQHSPESDDDAFASFANRGPRAGDGDLDAFDEQKPDLVAPGVAVLSADGDLTSDGGQYQRLSGTSMSAAFVSGAAACLRGSYPGLGPAAIADLLRRTAARDLSGLPSGPAGADPRWQSARGFGALDLYAARLELEQPGRSQVVRLELSATPGAITARLLTQRERGAAYFVFERAPDVGGIPGAFAPYDSAAVTGDSSLVDTVDRQIYPRTWSVPPAEEGARFWYRVSYTEAATRFDSPARAFTSPLASSLATLEVTIVHNAYDTDVNGSIVVVGSSGGPLRPEAASSVLTFPLPGSSAAVSSEWVDGISTLGNVAWTFRIEVPHGAAEAYLPPAADHPWWLGVQEAGFINRSGRITDYRLIWHDQNGDVVYSGGPLPRQTFEGGTAEVSIPEGTVGVAATPPALSLRASPNPLRAGEAVSFAIGDPTVAQIEVFDVAGREVGRAPCVPVPGGALALWRSTDRAGHPLSDGVYLVRAGRAGVVRVVVLR